MARSLTGGGFGQGGMLKEGTKSMQGLEEATYKNIDACKQLSNCIRTSLGPNGMNKMVINHLEKLFVTNDSATIMTELEVQHPAAKLLVMASKMQEQEIGDGTNLVVVLAGELLQQAESLLRMGLHCSEIITGYSNASLKAVEALNDMVVHTAAPEDLKDADKLSMCIKSCIASKQFGVEDFLAPLIAKACVDVMPSNPQNFNVDNIRVCKIIGGSLKASRVVKGMVLPRPCFGTIHEVKDAKIAVYGCALDGASTETKGTVLLENAEQLLNYNKSEEESIEKIVSGIAATGVNVVICGQAISEMAMHFLERYKILALKIPSKWELRRLCRTVGAVTLVRLAPPAPAEIGIVNRVYMEEIGSTKCTIFEHIPTDDTKVATIVVRGSTGNIMDDVERAVDDAVNVVKAIGRNGRFVPGAGTTEIRLSDLLQQFGASKPGLDQYAINKFAAALEIIPRTLAENAGLDATNILNALHKEHHNGDVEVGINVVDGGVSKVQVWDLLETKAQAIKLATEAAVTVLRVDQIIMAKAAGGPKAPAGGGGDD